MSVAVVKRLPYVLPLKRKFLSGSHVLHERRGVLIECLLEDGQKRFGDLCPLPGLNARSLDSLDELVQSCVSVEHLQALYRREDIDSALRFALEMIFEPRFSMQGQSALQLPLSALLMGNSAQLLEHLKAQQDCGYRVFKLKLGRQELGEDRALIEAVLAKLEGQSVLTIDANRAWSLQQAKQLFAGLNTQHILYVEEPLSDALQLPQFYEQTGLSLALDESLFNQTPEQFQPVCGVSHLVIKPLIVGGLVRSERWIRKADALGLKVAISSCLESGAGLEALVTLAGQHQGSVSHCGFDPYSWLDDDVFSPKLELGPILRGEQFVQRRLNS